MTTPEIPFDRNLLFGVLALQMDFIDRDQLVTAMGKWFMNRQRQLGDVLLQQGVLDKDVFELIERLVNKHLERHRGRADHGLTDLPAATVVRHALSHLSDSVSEETHTFTPRTTPESPDGSVSRSETWANDRYVVLRPHAKGGLGQVSVALDKQLDREVAFKELLTYHADERDTRARFELEARVTGALEHPGIVPVYSLGHNGRGQPYYAMRFVRGQNLREAIMRLHGGEGKRAHFADPLEIRRLLGCFIGVCYAIHYAHSRGVLHRDIKPHNILVGDFGETLVVDWGLAKPLGEAASGDDLPTVARNPLRVGSSDVTHLGSVVGTPNYMSPEQAQGDLQHLGPAADVFSLGATLYCLLTNQSPYRGPDPSVVLRKAQACDRPDVLVVNPCVPKPLAAICRKAMSRDAQGRYASARYLAKDLERWLADEPVAAHRDSWWEQMRRWGRKHRAAVRVALVALVLLAVGSATASVLIDQARRDVVASRRQALERLKQTRKSIDTWLTTTGEALAWDTESLEFQLIGPKVQEARRALLESAAKEYERLAADESDDLDLEIERARAHERLGKIRLLSGEPERAADEHRRAITVLSLVEVKWPGNAECLTELVNSHTQLGAALASNKQFLNAIEEYENALAVFERMRDEDARSVKAQDAKAAVTYNLARAELELRKFEDAAKLFAEAFSIYDELSRTAEDGENLRLKAAQLRGGAAQVDVGLGRYSAAAEQYQAVDREMDALVAAHPDRADFLEQRAVLRFFASVAWSKLGRIREELAANAQAKADFERLRQLRPDRITDRENHAISLLRLGEMQFRHESVADARSSLEAAKKEYAELVWRYPGVLRFREGLAHCDDALGVTLMALDLPAEAETCIGAAGAELLRLTNAAPERGEFHERLAVARSHYGQVLAEQGRREAAAQQFALSIEMLTDLIDGDPDFIPYRNAAAFANYYYGVLLHDNGQAAEARALFIEAEQLWRKIASRDEAAAEEHYNLARFHVLCPDVTLQDANAAMTHARSAVDVSPENPAYHGMLAAAWFCSGDWTKCLASLDASDRHRLVTNDWNQLFRGMAEHQAGRRDVGVKFVAEGKRWFAEHRGGDADIRRLVRKAEQLVGIESTPPRATEP